MTEFWQAGASVQGTSHVLAGKPCEDAHFIAENPDSGSFVLVACDGAGSERFAREGAAAVAPAVGKLMLSNAADVMARKLRPAAIIDVAVSTIERLVDEQGGGAVVSDFACTLVALLVHDGQAMTCHVGDGAIFVLEGEHPRCISPPDREPGGGSGTRFVTCCGVQPRMWSYKVPHYWTGFLCVTDGAQPALINTVTGACSQLVSRVMNRFDLADTRFERESLLADVVKSELAPRKSLDDITLVGARRAFIAGVYGCPECKRPTVKRLMNRDGTRYFGWCRACAHMACAHDENLEETRRSYERVALAAGVPVPVRASVVKKVG